MFYELYHITEDEQKIIEGKWAKKQKMFLKVLKLKML